MFKSNFKRKLAWVLIVCMTICSNGFTTLANGGVGFSNETLYGGSDSAKNYYEEFLDESKEETTKEIKEESEEGLIEEPEEDLIDEPEEDLADEPEEDLADEPEEDLADEPEEDLAEEPEEDLADEPEEDNSEDAHSEDILVNEINNIENVLNESETNESETNESETNENETNENETNESETNESETNDNVKNIVASESESTEDELENNDLNEENEDIATDSLIDNESINGLGVLLTFASDSHIAEEGVKASDSDMADEPRFGATSLGANEAYYTYDDSSKTLTLTGDPTDYDGIYAFGNEWDTTTLDYANVEKVIIASRFKPTKITSLFYGFSSVKSIEGLENLIVDDVYDMQYAFRNCENLTELDLTSWNFKGKRYDSDGNETKIDISWMCFECYGLKTVWVDKDNVDENNVKVYTYYVLKDYFHYPFQYCNVLVGGNGTRGSEEFKIDDMAHSGALSTKDTHKLYVESSIGCSVQTYRQKPDATSYTYSVDRVIPGNGVKVHLDDVKVPNAEVLVLNLTSGLYEEVTRPDPDKFDYYFEMPNSDVKIYVRRILTNNEAYYYVDGNTLYLTGDYGDGKRDIYTFGWEWKSKFESTSYYDSWEDCFSFEKVVIASNFKPNSLANLFSGFGKLTSIEGLNKINTDEVSSMNRTFCNCKKITSLDLSSWNFNRLRTWDTINVERMFYNCQELKTIKANPDYIKYKNFTNADDMFTNDEKLIGQNGTTINNSRLYDWRYAFRIDEIDDSNSQGLLSATNSYLIKVTKDFTDNVIVYRTKPYDRQEITQTLPTQEVEVAIEDRDSTHCYEVFVKGEKTGNYYIVDTVNEERHIFSYIMPREDVEIIVNRKIGANEMYYYLTSGDTEVVLTGDPTYKANVIEVNYDPLSHCFDGTKIKKVTVASNFKPTAFAEQFFGNMKVLEEFEGLEKINVEKVSNMNYLFCNDWALKELDLSGWDIGGSVKCMFYDCHNLETIWANDKSNFHEVWTSGYAEDPFLACTNLVGQNGTKYVDSYTSLQCFGFSIDNYDHAGYVSLKPNRFKIKIATNMNCTIETYREKPGSYTTEVDRAIPGNKIKINVNADVTCDIELKIYNEASKSYIAFDRPDLSKQEYIFEMPDSDVKIYAKKGRAANEIYYYYKDVEEVDDPWTPGKKYPAPKEVVLTLDPRYEKNLLTVGSERLYNKVNEDFEVSDPSMMGGFNNASQYVKKITIASEFAPTNLLGLFYCMRGVEEYEGLEKINVENVKEMSELFYSNEKIEVLDLSGWNLKETGTRGSNSINVNYMFGYCNSLKTIYVDEANFSYSAIYQPWNAFPSGINYNNLIGGNGTKFIYFDTYNYEKFSIDSTSNEGLLSTKDSHKIYKDPDSNSNYPMQVYRVQPTYYYEVDRTREGYEVRIEVDNSAGNEIEVKVKASNSYIPVTGPTNSWSPYNYTFIMPNSDVTIFVERKLSKNEAYYYFVGEKDITDPLSGKKVKVPGEVVLTADPKYKKIYSFGSKLSEYIDKEYPDSSKYVEHVTIASNFKPDTLAYLFNDMEGIKKYEGLEKINTDDVLDMQYLFYNASIDMTELDLSAWNFSGDSMKLYGLDVFNMFKSSKLETIYVDEAKYNAKERIRNSEHAMDGCTALIGGNGTKYGDAGWQFRIDKSDEKSLLSTKDSHKIYKDPDLKFDMTIYREKPIDLTPSFFYAPYAYEVDRTRKGYNVSINTRVEVDIKILNKASGSYISVDGPHINTIDYATFDYFFEMPDSDVIVFAKRALKKNEAYYYLEDTNSDGDADKLVLTGDERSNIYNFGDEWDATTYSFSRNLIKEIVIASAFKPTTIMNLFYDFQNLTDINGLNNLNTDDVTFMDNTFARNGKITSLDLSSWNFNNTRDDDTGSGTKVQLSVENMFSGCTSLKTILVDEKYINSMQLKNDTNMFKDCTSLIGANDTRYNGTNNKTMAKGDDTKNVGYFTATTSYTISTGSNVGADIDVYRSGSNVTTYTVNRGVEGQEEKIVLDLYKGYEIKRIYLCDTTGKDLNAKITTISEVGTKIEYVFNMPASNVVITLDLDFDPNRRYVYFMKEDRSVQEKRSIKLNATISLIPKIPDAMPKANHIFNHWYEEGKDEKIRFDFVNTIVKDDIYLYPYYVENKGGDFITLHIDEKNGMPIYHKTIEVGTPLSTLSEPIFKNHSFEHWYFGTDENTPFSFSEKLDKVTYDEGTISAKWKLFDKDDIRVRFERMDGTFMFYESVAKGTTLSQPDSSKEPKLTAPNRFEYWYQVGTTTRFDFANTKIVSPITIRSKEGVYDNTYHTITVDEDNGTPINNIYYLYVKDDDIINPASLSKPIKSGWDFEYWYDADSSKITHFDFANEKITGDRYLKAKYILHDSNYCTVTVDENNGLSNSAYYVYVLKDTLLNPASVSTPTYEGHTFRNWCTDISNSDTYYEFTEKVTKSFTLYAIYEKTLTSDKRVVHFMNEKDVEIYTKEVEKGATISEINNPTSATTSYAFIYWHEKGIDKAYDFSEPIYDDKYLYPYFEDLSNKIVLYIHNDLDNVNHYYKHVINEGTVLSTISEPKLSTNHSFEYWYFGTDENTPFDFTKKLDKTTYDKGHINAKSKPFDSNDICVRFERMDGTFMFNEYVKNGATLSQPSKSRQPQLTGNNQFEYWYQVGTTTHFDFVNTKITSPITIRSKEGVYDVDDKKEYYRVEVNELNGIKGNTYYLYVPKINPYISPASVSTPIYEGHLFTYWYTTNPSIYFDFNDKIKGNTTLNAKYDVNPNPSIKPEDYMKIHYMHDTVDIFYDYVLSGATASQPDSTMEPVETNKDFQYWYDKDSAKEERFDFVNTNINKETYLVAKFEDSIPGTTVRVTIDEKNGTNRYYKTVVIGTTLEKLSTPSYAGHVFAYWKRYKSITPFVPEVEVITSADNGKIIEAYWFIDDPSMKIVTFKNEGVLITRMQVPNGATISQPSKDDEPKDNGKNPNRVFLNWYKENGNPKEKFDFVNTPIVDDITIESNFELLDNINNYHKVTVNENNGAPEGNHYYVYVKDNELINKSSLSEPKYDGHLFTYWTKNKESKYYDLTAPVKESFDLNAHYTVNTYASADDYYKVHYMHDTVDLFVDYVVRGATVSQPDSTMEPIESNKTFLYWYDRDGTSEERFDFAGTRITSEKFLKARFGAYNSANDYIVTVNENNGVPRGNRYYMVVKKNGTINQASMSEPKYEGHVFRNWYKSGSAPSNRFTVNMPITGNIEIIANWYVKDPNAKVVTFKNEGILLFTEQVTINATLSQPDAVDEPKDKNGNANRVFLNWYKEGETASERFDFARTLIVDDITIESNFELLDNVNNYWKVTVNENNGVPKGNIYYVYVKKGEAINNASVIEPVYAGYLFTYWYKNNANSMYYDLNAIVDSNMTITAKWQSGSISDYFVVTYKKSDVGPVLFYDYVPKTSPEDFKQPDATLEPTIPVTPTENKKFTYWHEPSSPNARYDFANATLNGNLTLISKFEDYNPTSTARVTIDEKNATGYGNVYYVIAPKNQPLVVPFAPEKRNCIFVDWLDSANMYYDMSKNVVSDFAIHALWFEMEPGKVANDYILLTYKSDDTANASIASKTYTLASATFSALPGTGITKNERYDNVYCYTYRFDHWVIEGSGQTFNFGVDTLVTDTTFVPVFNESKRYYNKARVFGDIGDGGGSGSGGSGGSGNGASGQPSSAGDWYKDEFGRWRYHRNSSSSYYSGWLYEPRDQQWYYLDGSNDNIMQTGYHVIDNKLYCFFDIALNDNWLRYNNINYYYCLGKNMMSYGSLFRNQEIINGIYADNEGVICDFGDKFGGYAVEAKPDEYGLIRFYDKFGTILCNYVEYNKNIYYVDPVTLLISAGSHEINNYSLTFDGKDANLISVYNKNEMN